MLLQFKIKTTVLVVLFVSIVNGFAFQSEEDEEKKPYHPNAVELVIQGSIHDLKGEYNKALNAYNEALIYDPDSPSICYAIAKAYIMLGKIETAIQMLERGINNDPSYLENHQLLAAIFHRKGDLENAEKAYLQIINFDPTNSDAHLNLGAIYVSQKQNEKAADHYEKLIDWGVAGKELHFELGNLYFEDKKFDDAYRVFKNFVRDNPEDEAGYLAVGAVLVAQDTIKAVAWYRKTYEESENFKRVAAELTKTLVVSKKWDEAILFYENEIKKDSSDVASKIQLGGIYLIRGDTLQAVDILENVTTRHPKNWRAFYELGQFYFTDGKFGKSIPYFKKVVEFEETLPKPAVIDAWWHLGVAYQQEGDLDTAEANFRKAQSLNPANPSTNFNLGQLLFQKRNFDESVEFLLKAVAASPDNAVILGTLGMVYDAIDKHDKSEEYYKKALEIDPDNATILNNYSYSLSERSEHLNEALNMVNKALEADPENGAFLDTVGWIYFKLEEYEKALEYIKKAVEVRDASAEVMEHLGDVYEKLGQIDLALEAWKKAKELDPDRASLVLKLKNN